MLARMYLMSQSHLLMHSVWPMATTLKFTPAQSPLPQKEDIKLPWCEYYEKEVVPNPKWVAKKLNIDYSSYKLNLLLYYIWGKHVNHGIELMNSFHTKGAPIVAKVLSQCKYNGLRKGFSEE